MDVMKLFEEYLPIWSEEKMQPIPTPDHPDRWALAWKDFQNSYLKDHYDELCQEYKNMTFKTRGMQEKEKNIQVNKIDTSPQIIPKDEPIISEWDKIKKMLE